MHIVFGELAPKSIAIQKSVRTVHGDFIAAQVFLCCIPALYMGAEWLCQFYFKSY
jgi:CBS domain containing-hemolysin-like protein